MSALATALSQVVRVGLHDTLTTNGYKKTGNRDYHSVQKDHVRVLSIVLDKFWGLGGEGKFFIKLGVFFNDVADVMGKRMRGSLPSPGECYPLQQGLGSLVPEAATDAGGRFEIRWVIGADTELDALAEELREAWEHYGRQWMEQCSTLLGARDWLAENAYLWYACRISVMLGERAVVPGLLARLLEHQSTARDTAIPWAVEEGFIPATAVPRLRHALMQDVATLRSIVSEILQMR